MIYKEHEIDITATDFLEGVAIIPLPNGEIVCIPEDGATSEELNIIQIIKADVEARPPIEHEPITPEPTLEQRNRADIDYLLMMTDLA